MKNKPLGLHIKKDKLTAILFFLMGLFACMNSFGIYLGGIGATFFTILQIFLIFYRLLFKGLKIYHKKTSLTWMFLAGIFSTLINFFLLPSMWVMSGLTTMCVTLIGYGAFYWLFSDNELVKYRDDFLKGLKINFLIQLFWAYAQFIAANYFQISLNEAVHLYMPKTLGLSQSVSGLGWERAELALLLMFGFVLFKKNVLIQFLTLICFVLMQSRTAFIMLGFLLLSALFFNDREKNQKNMIEYMVLFFVVIFALAFYWKPILTKLAHLWNSIIHFRQDGSGLTHAFYYMKLAEMLRRIPIIHWLFGFGMGCSGYPYSALYGINSGFVWSVESTILSQLWSIGIVGFVFWLVWMCSQGKRAFRRNNKMVGALFFIIIICSVFYSLLCNWGMTVLILLSAQPKRKSSVKAHCTQQIYAFDTGAVSGKI